jgi:hypothetical protein
VIVFVDCTQYLTTISNNIKEPSMLFMKVISRVLPVAIIVVTALQLQPMSNDAKAGIHDILRVDQTGSCKRCPACDYQCKLNAEIVDEEKPCFDVESKVICIPRVVFPWQRKKCLSCGACDGLGCTHCVNNGARTRRISVLKNDSYKCPKCKYSWSAEKIPCVSESSRKARPRSTKVATAGGLLE